MLYIYMLHAFLYPCKMGCSVYYSKFHPNKIHTYRLTYCFPLHLFSKILSVVFIKLFNKMGLFKLLWNHIPLLEEP